MKNWIIKNKIYFIGGFIGAIGGFLYWHFIGCASGTCAITSNPINSTLYFMMAGSIFAGAFKKDKESKGEKNNDPSLNKPGSLES